MAQERVMPHNLDAEKALLGAMIMDPEARLYAISEMDPDEFYAPSHQTVFSTISELFRSGVEALDLTILMNALHKNGELVPVGGLAYLTEILQSVATSANADYHAEIVKEAARKRKIIKEAYAMVELAFEDATPSDQIIENMSNSGLLLHSKKEKGGLFPISKCLGGALEVIEHAHKTKEVLGSVQTGFSRLDSIIGGLCKTDLIVLAARTSQGKTSLSCNIAANTAKAGYTVAYFSLEMSRLHLAIRLLCTEARISSSIARRGMISDQDMAELVSASNRVFDSPLFIDDQCRLRPTQIYTRAKMLRQQTGNLDLIIVDHIQFMRAGRERNMTRAEEMSEISLGLKDTAKQLDVPVLAISHLNRGSDKMSENSAPKLSDLKESSSIEQDADIVMFLHRKRDTQTRILEPETKLIIAKNRNGECRCIDLMFNPTLTEFTELDRHADEVEVSDDLPFGG